MGRVKTQPHFMTFKAALLALALSCAGLPAFAQEDTTLAPEIPPVAPSAPVLPGAAGATPVAGPAKPAFKPIPAGINSVLFSSDDSNKIRRALEIYRRSLQPVAVVTPVKSKDEEDFLSKIARGMQTKAASAPGAAPGTPQAPVPFNFPKFYMESMMRYSDNNWTVWLGGKKFTTLKPVQGELEVVQFDPTSVKFIWRPTDILPLVEAYNKNPDHSPQIKVDEIKSEVRFSLSPNQTFHTDRMKIEEGKYFVVPVVKPAIDASVKPGVPGQEGAPPAPGTAATNPDGTPANGTPATPAQAGAAAMVPAPQAPASNVAPLPSSATPTATTPPSAPSENNQGLQGLQNLYNNQLQGVVNAQ